MMAVHSPARCCLVIAIIAFSIAGCVGYRFGNNTLYAPNVRTIYVPVFRPELRFDWFTPDAYGQMEGGCDVVARF